MKAPLWTLPLAPAGRRPRSPPRPQPWGLPQLDFEAEAVLTDAARATSAAVEVRRSLPGLDEIVRQLHPGARRWSEQGLVQLIEAVVASEVWTTLATDPKWRVVAPRPQTMRVRKQRVRLVSPAVLMWHPHEGLQYTHWIDAPYEGGRGAWDYLNILLVAVIRQRRLNLWRDRLVGSLYLTRTKTCVRRRLFPEHLASGIRLVRASVRDGFRDTV